MAQAKMPDVAALVRKIYRQFPPASQDKTKGLLRSKDYRGLFNHLEGLISSRALDDLLMRNEKFRTLMSETYGPRYPWLQYADLGAALWEEEQDREAEFIRQEAKNMDRGRRASIMAEYERAAARLLRGRERDHDSLPKPSKGDVVPLAPSAGGPAPREPFPTGWTYRSAPEGSNPAFDPESTWKDFVIEYSGKKMKSKDTEKGEKESNGQDDAAGATTADVLAKSTVVQQDVGDSGAEDDENDGIPKDWSGTVHHRDWNPQWFTTLDKILAPLPGGMPKRKARLDWEAEKIREELCLLMDDIGLDSGKLKPSHVEKMLPAMRKKARQRYPTVKDKEPTHHSSAMEGLSSNLGMSQTKTLFARALLRWFGIRKAILQIGSKETNPGDDDDIAMVDPEPPEAGGAGGNDGDIEMIDAHLPGNTSTDLVQSENVPAEPTTSPGLYDENWLINWLREKDEATPQDVQMMEYRGWRIHSPKIQLIRIKNYLADEDIDRTLGWKGHFAEIAVYLQHLLSIYKNEDWGWDLKEAILMLRTHWLYEQHHYGLRKLNLDFSDKVMFPQRLKAPALVPPVTIAESAGRAVQGKAQGKPRYLIHRKPESIHDVDYQLPASFLHSHFYAWYRQDDTRLWNVDLDDPFDPKPELVGSGQRGVSFRYSGYSPDFNMSHVADVRYMKCMILGPSETARALRQEANFYLSKSDLVTTSSGEEIPNGHAARRFAEYRGAKRAALQQVLTHFNNDENVALANAFRRVVLPIPIRERERIEEEARKEIVYKPLALMQPPSGEKLDPLGFVYWHSHLLANHAKRATRARQLVERAHRERMENSMREGGPVVLRSANFLGPYIPSYLAGREETQFTLLKKLSGIHDLLKLAQRRAPRELLDQILTYWDMGTKMAEPKDQAVAQELRRQSEALKKEGESREYKAISERDLHWMRFIAGPSTNDALLDESRAFIPATRRMEIFAERMQALLDDRWPESVLASSDVERTVAEVKKAVNKVGTHDGTKHDMMYFVAREVVYYGKLLADAGRLGFRQKGDEVSFSRPKYKYHPEMRIDWYSFKCPEPSDLDTLPPPRTTPPLSWETAISMAKHGKEASQGDPTKGSRAADVTALAFKLIAWRMGAEAAGVRRTMDETYERLAMEGAGSTFTAAVDSHRLQLYDMHDVWTDEVFCARAESGGPPVKYAAVARAAYPALFRGTDKLPLHGEVHHDEAVETVRAGLIRELSEAKNMLWPARQRFRPGEQTVMTLQREPVWEWAKAGRRGMRRTGRQWFSLDRWPLHLQSPGRRQEMAREMERRPPLDTDIVFAAGEAPVPSEGAHGTTEQAGGSSSNTQQTTMSMATHAPALGGEMQSVAIDGPLTQTIRELKRTVQARKRQRSSSVQSDEVLGLTRPIAEAFKPMGAFEAGKTGMLLADTPLKKAAIDDATVRLFKEALGQPEDDEDSGPSWAGSSWNPFASPRKTPSRPRKSRKYVGPAVPLPAVLPSEVPKSVPPSIAWQWPLDVGDEEQDEAGEGDGDGDEDGPAQKKVRVQVGGKTVEVKKGDKKWNMRKAKEMLGRREYSSHLPGLMGHEDDV